MPHQMDSAQRMVVEYMRDNAPNGGMKYEDLKAYLLGHGVRMRDISRVLISELVDANGGQHGIRPSEGVTYRALSYCSDILVEEQRSLCSSNPKGLEVSERVLIQGGYREMRVLRTYRLAHKT